MNPYQKGAQLLIRLVAAGMILIGGMLAGLEFLNHRARHVDLDIPKITLHSLVVLAGVALLVISRKLAARLTGETEENDDEETSDS